MLTVEKLTFSYDKINILDEVSFVSKSNQITSIVGKNGAGKSTLLKCICGLLAHHGRVFREKKQLPLENTLELSKIISYVPQVIDDTCGLTLEDFLDLAKYPYMLSYRPLTNEEQFEKEQIISDLDLAPVLKTSINKLSGGQRQLAYIAGAIFQETPVLILDEVYSGLDFHIIQKIQRYLKDWVKTNGRTIIQVTHDLNLATKMSHQIIGLKNGRGLFAGAPSEFLKEETISSLFDFSPQMINSEEGVFLLP